MLKGSLYRVITLHHTDNMIHAVLQLDVQNEVFSGHFPGRPVLPAACMVQMVKEVFEEGTGAAYRLEKTDSLKFLTLVNPSITDTLQLELSYITDENGIKVNANLATDEGVAFKLQGTFIK